MEAADNGNSGARPPRSSRRRMATWGGFLGFLAVLFASIHFWGLPWSRDRLAVWIVLGLLAVSLSDLRRWGRGIVVDWLPLFGVLFVYDWLRGYADGAYVKHAHVMPQIHVDEAMFGGTVPTVALQQALWDPVDPHWYDYVAWVVYTSHFFMAIVVAAVLWKVAYDRFRPFVAMFVTLTVAGYITYVLYPAAPPWLASYEGHLAPVTRTVPEMWLHVGLHPAAALFEVGSDYANDVAAVPSLHAAYPLLLLLFFWRGARGWVRPLLVAYPIAMAFTLVYSGEHYFVDILLGWGYAATAFVVFAVGSRLRARRRQPVPVERERLETIEAPVPVAVTPSPVRTPVGVD